MKKRLYRQAALRLSDIALALIRVGNLRRAGGSAVPADLAPTPASPTPAPYVPISPSFTPDWLLSQADPGYMSAQKSIGERRDIAGANRQAALRALAVRCGGLSRVG